MVFDLNGKSEILCQKWVDGTYSNYGILIPWNSAGTSEDISCRSSEYSDANYYPRLFIDYTESAPAESISYMRLPDDFRFMSTFSVDWRFGDDQVEQGILKILDSQTGIVKIFDQGEVVKLFR
jgi:hypothetical protein